MSPWARWIFMVSSHRFLTFVRALMTFCSKKLTPPSGFYCFCLKPEPVLEEIAMERLLVSYLILKCNLRPINFFCFVALHVCFSHQSSESCKNCGQYKVRYYTRQVSYWSLKHLRSTTFCLPMYFLILTLYHLLDCRCVQSDEGQTLFNECKGCGHNWSENS
jgi:hypothetical protein